MITLGHSISVGCLLAGCSNGGTCLLEGFTCECVEGYTGDLCDEEDTAAPPPFNVTTAAPPPFNVTTAAPPPPTTTTGIS